MKLLSKYFCPKMLSVVFHRFSIVRFFSLFHLDDSMAVKSFPTICMLTTPLSLTYSSLISPRCKAEHKTPVLNDDWYRLEGIIGRTMNRFHHPAQSWFLETTQDGKTNTQTQVRTGTFSQLIVSVHWLFLWTFNQTMPSLELGLFFGGKNRNKSFTMISIWFLYFYTFLDQENQYRTKTTDVCHVTKMRIWN